MVSEILHYQFNYHVQLISTMAPENLIALFIDFLWFCVGIGKCIVEMETSNLILSTEIICQ